MQNSTRNFYFRDDLPTHHQSYCAFLDVLGFSDQITESHLKNTHNSLLNQFHQTLNESIQLLNEYSTHGLTSIRSLTDNLIICIPQISRDMESELGSILSLITSFQMTMIRGGFFIRGGLAIGDLFVDQHSVFGPALIEAYQIETKISVNPIVTLSQSTASLVQQHLSYYARGWDPHRKDILINSDGNYFINYLSECVEDERILVSSIENHKDQVITKLNEHRSNPRIFSKYSWVAEYHNYFCSMITGYPEYTSDLTIEEQLIHPSFSQLPLQD